MNPPVPARDEMTEQGRLPLRGQLHVLKRPENPYIGTMLEVIDQLREDVAGGKIAAFSLMGITEEGGFTVRALGQISTIELVGLLEIAKADALRLE